MIYQYNNKKSPLNGQIYRYHTIDGRVYLTPISGKAKAQIRMPFNAFTTAKKDGYYREVKPH